MVPDPKKKKGLQPLVHFLLIDNLGNIDSLCGYPDTNFLFSLWPTKVVIIKATDIINNP